MELWQDCCLFHSSCDVTAQSPKTYKPIKHTMKDLVYLSRAFVEFGPFAKKKSSISRNAVSSQTPITFVTKAVKAGFIIKNG